jgi:alcohol dehydrogenase
VDLWPYNAKHLGAYVATTVSTNDKQFVQGLGADQVIDYKTENFADMTHNYDAVFDTVGGDTYKRSFKVLKKGSSMIVSMLEQPNSELFLLTQVVLSMKVLFHTHLLARHGCLHHVFSFQC